MFTVWQLLADFRAGKTISLVKSHATICFASYSAWQTRITRSPNDITLLWCRIQSFSEIENNKFVYGLQNSFVFVVALILDYIPLNHTRILLDCRIYRNVWEILRHLFPFGSFLHSGAITQFEFFPGGKISKQIQHTIHSNERFKRFKCSGRSHGTVPY